MEPPSPQCVGREFVRQYYTLLNQAPLHLHRFYSHNSSFVHGGLENGKEAEAVYGQQDIHQKIMQLNFRDCHAKIRQVDSHETLANGVVVQVSGELSNNGEPMRRFMQTFVLAPQSPKKYYVHNDIFRYQDEVFDDPDTSTGTNTTEEQIREIKEMNAEVVKQQQPPVVDTTKEIGGVQHTNGSTSFEEPSNTAAMEVEEPVVEWKENSVASPEPIQQAWKSPEPAEPVEAVEEAEDVGDVVGAVDVGEEVPSSDAPRTWSSLVKSGAPGAGAVANKPPAGLAREVKEGTPGPVSGAGAPAGAPGSAKPGYRPARGSSQGRQPAGARRSGQEDNDQAKSNGDSQQLFVGNLPHNCTDEELVELFSKFGKVNDVRINQKQARQDSTRGRDGKPSFVPNFGFIVFADAESVEKALSAKPILLYGNHRLNVEEKKMRTPRDSTGPSGFSDRDRQDMGKRGSQDNLRGGDRKSVV